MLVLPLIPLAMFLTFIAGLAGLVAPSIAEWFGLPAYGVLHYVTTVVGWIASLPGAQGELQFDTLALIVSYIALTVVIVWLWHKTKHNFLQKSIVD